jgi:hypothetical protein
MELAGIINKNDRGVSGHLIRKINMTRNVVLKKKQATTISELVKVIDEVKLDILRQIADEYQVSLEILLRQYVRKSL